MNTKIQDAQDMVSIFRQYAKDVYNFVYFRVGQKQHLAEDLAQEVFLRALKYNQSFDSNKASIKTWLFTIARNLIIDHYKSAKPSISLDEDISTLEDINLPDLDQPIMAEQIREKINKLNETDRELILMRYIDQFEIKEMSEYLNKEISATKVAIHRALTKLKQLVITG